MKILSFIVSFYLGITACYAYADDIFVQNNKDCIYVNFVVAEHFLKKHCRLKSGCDITKAQQRWDELTRMPDKKGCLTQVNLFDVFAMGYSVPYNDLRNSEKKQIWLQKFDTSFFKPLVAILEDVAFIENAVVEKYDGYRSDPCTASVYTGQNNESDVLCATESYVTDSAFKKAMDTKFRLEGGCAPVKDGNCFTCYGVGAKWNNEVAELKYNSSDMFFNRADAEKIAYDKYYYPRYKDNQQIKRLPAAISGDVFMAKWGAGNAKQSIGYLQEILGVTADGKIGDATIKAAQEYRGDLRKLFLEKRWLEMKDSKFADGWRKAFEVYLKNGCYSIAAKGDVVLNAKKQDARCSQSREKDIDKIKNYIKTGHSICLDKRLRDSAYEQQKAKIPEFREKLYDDIKILDSM